MNTHRFPGQVTFRVCLVLLLVVLAFQSFGMNGLAAPSASTDYIQDGEDAQQLSCTCSSSNLQVVLMIDDSGSMRANDPNPETGRHQDAKALVELLAGLRSKPEWGIRDVQAAVLHFNWEAAQDPAWKRVDSSDDLDQEIEKTFAPIKRGTNFSPPFEKAKELFLAAQADCSRRSIVVFTDGTPEDELRRISGSQLVNDFKAVRSTIQQIPGLDGVYVIGYQRNANYLNEEIKQQWARTVTWYGFERNLSTSQDEVPRFELIPSRELLEKFTSEKAVSETEFSRYQMAVEFNPGQDALQANTEGDVKFRVMLSGDEPRPGLNAENVSAAFRQEPIPLSEDGDQYGFSWTPANVSEVQFGIAADFMNDSGDVLLSCSGSVVRPVLPPIDPDSGLGLVIESSGKQLQQDETIILPVRLDVNGNMNNLEWDPPTAKTIPDGSSVEVTWDPDGTNDRERRLIVGPLGRPGEVEVGVNAKAVINGHNISSGATARLMIAQDNICQYGSLWDMWFWPLVILLAGLMILLLVLRFWNRREEPEEREGIWNIFRRREWHILFWPLLVLLILLLLVRPMEWTCILPPWLFLVSILAWAVMLLLLRFIPGHGDFPRPRPWWLVLLLLALIFVGFLTIAVPLLTLLWLLLVLVATWVTLWYISPYRPIIHKPSAVFSLAFTPPCVPFNESITLPLRLEYKGSGALLKTVIWSPTAEVIPGGEVAARVVPVNEGNGEYNLIVDPVSYDKDAREIQVHVRAQVIFADGRSLEINGQRTRIEICQPDDLSELEGIGDKVRDLLYRKGILTFKQLAGAVKGDIISLLDLSDLKMMDPKTWPQQAKLAHIAREFGGDDQQNYEAYKAWLRNGIEPDEYEMEEPDRRRDALVWNKIAEFTPLVLNLALSPTRLPTDPIKLPMQVSPNGDKDLLSIVDWKAGAKSVPDGVVVGTALNAVDLEHGKYELVIDPVTGADEIQVSVQAMVNGRSIELYDRAVTLQVPYGTPGMIPPPVHDDLTELEGIEKGVQNLLNANNIHTFKQLAEADPHTIEGWLKEKPWGKMMDPKTWPQQAKLADIAKRYGKEEDRQNYEAYKAWLAAGIEPDEADMPETDRRPDALSWNGISKFTPVILSLALSPSSKYRNEAITLPVQLNNDGDRVRLSSVEWKVSAKALPGGAEVATTVNVVDPQQGKYEIVINPVQAEESKEIQVTAQAAVNGRSIEIYYGKAITVEVWPPAPERTPDRLEELEGIGPAVAEVLNDNGIFTFRQLAKTDFKDIKAWLDECGYEQMDPKTWPQQAKLADVAKDYGRAEDQQSYNAYRAWLKNGIEPDEVDRPESDRRAVALVWYGTAELTEKAYPEIFKAR